MNRLFKNFDEEFFKSVLDHMLEGVQIIDTEYRYVYLNEVACQQGRKPREELIGRPMLEAFPQLADTPVYGKICDCMASGQPERIENQFEHTNGDLGWFDIHIEPVPGGVMIRSIEITEAKKIAQEMKARARELAAKNKDLEDFTYIASHDLRAPLRHISSFASLLEKELRETPNEKVEKWLDYILSGTQRMMALLDDLMKYSRADKGRLELSQVSISDIIQNVLMDLSVNISESKAEIVTQKMPTAVVDKIKVHQVLQNLIENAIKFRKPNEAPQVRLYASETNSYWKIYVADNGLGIDSEFFERVFQPFQRLHAQKEMAGAGMGLAICKKIVELHGGILSVESIVGDGSVFSFTLPKNLSPGTTSEA